MPKINIAQNTSVHIVSQHQSFPIHWFSSQPLSVCVLLSLSSFRFSPISIVKDKNSFPFIDEIIDMKSWQEIFCYSIKICWRGEECLKYEEQTSFTPVEHVQCCGFMFANAFDCIEYLIVALFILNFIRMDLLWMA